MVGLGARRGLDGRWIDGGARLGIRSMRQIGRVRGRGGAARRGRFGRAGAAGSGGLGRPVRAGRHGRFGRSAMGLAHIP
ncbi:hypothetical protein GCM10009839_74460 [Catenulispora yoronensis]|uniref:Uncharacterized protein n=1 Tax=Catenulispora yoronensis TaxID=450799 RepID=A0ABP5GRL0_9ACTN